jgi:hypothetical protein
MDSDFEWIVPIGFDVVVELRQRWPAQKHLTFLRQVFPENAGIKELMSHQHSAARQRYSVAVLAKQRQVPQSQQSYVVPRRNIHPVHSALQYLPDKPIEIFSFPVVAHPFSAMSLSFMTKRLLHCSVKQLL